MITETIGYIDCDGDEKTVERNFTMNEYDFVDYLLRYDVLYESGVIFAKDAFKICDRCDAPIVMSRDVHNLGIHDVCLGIAIIENRDDGVVAKCKFGNTDEAKIIKEQFANDDYWGISIYANRIQYDESTIPTREKRVLSANIMCVTVLPKGYVLRPAK